MGRFISEDPARDPNNPNLYTYARNNPLRFFDPTGLISLADIGLSTATTGLSSEELNAIQIDKPNKGYKSTGGLTSSTSPALNVSAPKIDVFNSEYLEFLEERFKSTGTDPKVQELKFKFLTGEISYDELEEYGITYRDLSENELIIFSNYAEGLRQLYKKKLITYEQYMNERDRLGGYICEHAFGSISSDPGGNIALAAGLFLGHQITTGVAVYSASKSAILDVSIKVYMAGQSAWNHAKGLISKMSSRFSMKVPIDKIKINPEDPFNYAGQNYNSQVLKNYRNYIAQHGTIPEPIMVTKVGDSYMILDGHHRYWAATQMGLKEIPIRIQ